MKPVVEGMGLDWKTQHRKMTAKFKGMVEMTIPSASSNQTMTCLPLRKLPAWLYLGSSLARSPRDPREGGGLSRKSATKCCGNTGPPVRPIANPSGRLPSPTCRNTVRHGAIKMTADAITVALSVMRKPEPGGKASCDGDGRQHGGW